MKTRMSIAYPAFALFALACFALSPQARAVCQQGCDLINANTFLGDQALVNNTTGVANTATGSYALFSNTTGILNTAIGNQALQSNTTGGVNTATGSGALGSNTTGSNNTANGYSTLGSNTIGFDNTAIGLQALILNTEGSFNTATGSGALFSNTTGAANTATGYSTLVSNITGSSNTATGYGALQSTIGNSNTANGALALLSNTTGENNIALGASAGINLTTGSNNIHIGNPGVAGESRRIRIGTPGTHKNTSIAGIGGAIVADGVGVIIGAGGHLGTVVSSERFKDNIQPIEKASETILALKPVTFRYKKDLDPESIPQFGLVAEDVAKVNPDLVARDEQGKPYTVRYEAVNAMLLNEFLKEHKKVEEQQATIAQLKSTVAQQQKGFEAKLAKQEERIETLTAGLQKVSDQLELRKFGPQITATNP